MTAQNWLVSAFVLTGCAASSKSTQSDAPAAPFPDVTVALMVRLEVKPDRTADVAALLRDGRGLVDQEPGTPYWFAIQIGPTTFGIFDAFPGDAERQAHLDGKLAQALLAKAPEVLASPPVIEKVDVIGKKHAFATASRDVAFGLAVRIDAKPENAGDVGALLAGGAAVVAEEPGTPLWFGVRIDADTFAIFDAFATTADRDAHLRGKLAKALGDNAALLAAQPVIEPVDVIATKIP